MHFRFLSKYLFQVIRESAIWSQFEVHQNRIFPRAVILADSGYMCNDWLITPFLGNLTAAQQRFNNALTATRSCVERCFGVLKQRFHSLHVPIRFKDIEDSSKLIVVACILHNLCISLGDDGSDLDGPDWLEGIPLQDLNPPANQHQNFSRRQQLLQHFMWFSRQCAYCLDILQIWDYNFHEIKSVFETIYFLHNLDLTLF